MNAVVLIITMIIIGALIGGLTNSLAIKMLFRPHKPIYLGKFRLPFTPGVIPKRREELARQLGNMVTEHLLTPEGLRRKLERPAFQKQMTEWAQDEVEKILQNPTTLDGVLKAVDVDLSTEDMEITIARWVEERCHFLLTNYRETPVEDLLSESWMQKAETGADQLADYIQYKITSYLESEEGKRKVTALIENYLDNQGFLGNMISSFMGPDGLTEKVHPAIIHYVSDQETNVWLRSMLQSEVQQLREKPVSYFEDKIGKAAIAHSIGEVVSRSLPLEEWLSRSVAEWSRPVQSKILHVLVPMVVPKVTALLSDRMETMMNSMHLSEVVQEQVEAFQVERLEEMVLSISSREFKMITYLGALLGGTIGILQGVIVLLFG